MASKLRDIAAEAGVSVATVSRVLSGVRPVSPELRVRVLAAVENRGYRPNVVARSLRTRKTFVIGVIIPSIVNPFFTAVVRAIEDVALQAGYAVTISSSDQDVAKETRHLEIFRTRMVDAILATVADTHRSDLAPLLQSNMPVVLVDRLLAGAQLDTVTVNTTRGACNAVTYLLERGYKRIAILGGPPNVSTAVDKLQGYLDALHNHGVPVDTDLIVSGDYSEASGASLGRVLLDLPHPPDAILAANNQMTLGLFTILQERGMRLPQEIGLIGFDDARWTAIARPPITVVDQPTYELGRVATQLLLERIRNSNGGPRHEVLNTRLIVRGSC